MEKKSSTVLLIFMTVLLVLQIIISFESLYSAVTSNNIINLLIYGIPILIVIGAIFVMIKIWLKPSEKSE
jgi:hypothetical protein